MRPVLLVALLSLVVAPAAGASAPTATTDAPTPDHAAVQGAAPTLSGTVSYLNGSTVADATVLVGSESRLGNASAETLRTLAADPPGNVATATTNASGEYSLTVGEDVDAETVVAVSEGGASRPRSYTVGSLDLTIRTTTALSFESPSLTAEPSERIQVPFTLENTGDEPVEGVSLSLALPDGWNHVSASSGSGTFHEDNRTFTWDAVAPGESVEASFRIYVGLNAINGSARTYELTTFAGSHTHPVDAPPAEISVRYPTETTATDVPGFGLPAALVAVAALAGAGVLARRD